MSIVNIPQELSSVRPVEGSAVSLARGAGELDSGLHRTGDMVALLEQ